MMRINLHEMIDGVAYHVEVESIAEADTFLAFLEGKRAPAVGELQAVTGYNTGNISAVLADALQVQGTATYTAPMTVAGNVPAPKVPWTRENLQPVVVGLAKQRDKFVALLEKFGVARFRDLPDDKLNDFGVACAAVAA